MKQKSLLITEDNGIGWFEDEKVDGGNGRERDVRGERGDRDLLWVAMEYSMEEFALFVSLDS